MKYMLDYIGTLDVEHEYTLRKTALGVERGMWWSPNQSPFCPTLEYTKQHGYRLLVEKYWLVKAITGFGNGSQLRRFMVGLGATHVGMAEVVLSTKGNIDKSGAFWWVDGDMAKSLAPFYYYADNIVVGGPAKVDSTPQRYEGVLKPIGSILATGDTAIYTGRTQMRLATGDYVQVVKFHPPATVEVARMGKRTKVNLSKLKQPDPE
jgi:hypothetical protein